MALVQTHRFNWMGHEGTQSETLNLALLRPSTAGNLRYSDYQQRQQVVEEISMRLKLIKRDLGLLPPEEALLMKERSPTEKAELDADSKHDEHVENFLAKVAGRRRALHNLKDTPVLSDGEEVFCFPTEPKEREQTAALNKFNLAVRSLLYRAGETYVSYLDGSEFTRLPQLTAHNEERRAAVQEAAGMTLPDEDEFNLTFLQSALEKRNQLRMKLDAVRAARDPTYAASCIRREELNENGEPVMSVKRLDGTEQEIATKLMSAQKELNAARMEHNKQAYNISRHVLRALANSVVSKEEEVVVDDKSETDAFETLDMNMDAEPKREERVAVSVE